MRIFANRHDFGWNEQWQIWPITEGKQDNLWFASFNNCVFKYIRMEFGQLTKMDGLVDLWISVLCIYNNFHCPIFLSGCKISIHSVKNGFPLIILRAG
jgi:hypothetical protein